MIVKVVGACEIAEHKEGDKVKSPGVKYSHYKPKCQTALFEYGDYQGLKSLYNDYLEKGKTPYVMCSNDVAKNLKGFNILNLGSTGEEIAFNLYDKLLEGETKADIIIAMAMKNEEGVYLGISNRLRKSCQ